MKLIKWIVPALALTLGAAGCILVSGQFFVYFEFDGKVVTETNLVTKFVDLNAKDETQPGYYETLDDYREHKDELRDVVDIAVLGKITNNGPNDIGVEVWMTDGQTNFADRTEVVNGARRLWGPFRVPSGGMKKIDWNESANLFNPEGKKQLVNEIKGENADGKFTIYIIGDNTSYSLDIDNGALALTLDYVK